MLLKVAAGESRGEDLRKGRGWSEESWADAQRDLVGRGWVDAVGALTDAGRAIRAAVEDATDAAAEGPWAALSQPEVARVEALLAPVAASIWADDLLPLVNPIGVLPSPGE